MEPEKTIHDDDNIHVSNKKTKKRVRLSFNLTPDLRRRIKLAALNQNLSLSKYLGQVLEKVLPLEEDVTKARYHPVTNKTLEAVDRIRERLMQGREENFFGDSVESIRQMREERSNY